MEPEYLCHIYLILSLAITLYQMAQYTPPTLFHADSFELLFSEYYSEWHR